METKRKSYSEVLKTLEVPADAPTSKVCLCCGQQMHIIRVNPYFVYFIHTPTEAVACAEKNPTGTKLPMIWSNKLIIRKQLEKYYEEITGKKPESQQFKNMIEDEKDAAAPTH